MTDLARYSAQGERLCPHCAERVAEQATRCFMCGTPLDGRVSMRRVPGSEALLCALVVGAGVLWFSRASAGRESSADLTPAPIARLVVQTTATEETLSAITETPINTPNVATATPVPRVTPTEMPQPTPTLTYYEVQQGDSMIGIAGRFNTTVDAIMAANNLTGANFLSIGQRLLIPQVGTTVAPAPAAAPTIKPTNLPASVDLGQGVNYRVKAGDTVQQISAQFKIPVEQIIASNTITDPNNLPLGKVLVLMRATPMPTLTATPHSVATPTSVGILPAAWLLSPAQDGQMSDESVNLEWSAVSTLADDQWYAVRVWELNVADGQPPRTWSQRTRTTSLRLPRDWQPVGGEARRYRWSVLVVKETEDGLSTAASLPSEIREFTWAAK